MRRRPSWLAAVVASLPVLSAPLHGCGSPAADAPASHDHVHGGGAAVTRWTADLELFVEYPPHVRGVAGDPWAIHLTWLDTWSPVDEGSLALVLLGPEGARVEVAMEAPVRPGVFAGAPTLPAAGRWRADLTLTVGDDRYAIPVGEVRVFESALSLPHHHAEPASPELITLLKEQQWEMPFAVKMAEERGIAPSLRAGGEIAVPAGKLVQVATPVPGLVMADAAIPAVGQRVREGEALAYIAPTSIDDSFARLRADVMAARREADRAERLFAAGAIAASRLEHARHELEVAAAAFEGVGGEGAAAGADGAPDRRIFALRAPISGVVTARRVDPGEQVEAGRSVFTVVDPSTVWFVAKVPALDVPSLAELRGAWFTVEGGARVHGSSRVVSVGGVVDPATRAVEVRFAVPNHDGALKLGMLADGRLRLGDPVRGVAVPAAAIRDEDGLAVVYVEVGGEAFRRRAVEAGPSDGEWTLVSGVAEGERVVTTGAYQVKLASVADADAVGHGHVH